VHVLRVHYNANLSARPGLALLIFIPSEMKLPYASGEIIPIGANHRTVCFLLTRGIVMQNLRLRKYTFEFYETVTKLETMSRLFADIFGLNTRPIFYNCRIIMKEIICDTLF